MVQCTSPCLIACAAASLTHRLCLLVVHVTLTHRLAAELEEEEVMEGPGPAGDVLVSEEVLQSLRGMEQQVQVALLELKKKDQQLVQERSCTGRFKASVQQNWEAQTYSFLHPG